jgi:hypothetical protein
MYKIIMMSGETYLVNKSEYLAIMKADGGVFVPRIEVFINCKEIRKLERQNELTDHPRWLRKKCWCIYTHERLGINH